MRAFSAFLVLVLLAPPLAAVKLKLKAEDKEVETTVDSLVADEVTFTRGRRESRAHIDDFEPASAFVIKSRFTPAQARPTLELARFAQHRGLFDETRESASTAVRLDAGLKPEADNLVLVADILEAEALIEAAYGHMEGARPAEARAALSAVRERLGHTPAAIKAEVLLGTLADVELAIKSRSLEDEARKAQDAADADEQKKRKPVDDWLASLDDQIKAGEARKLEGDVDSASNKVMQGLPKYESVIVNMTKLRKAIEDNRRVLAHRGQGESANALDARARKLMVDCYERWAYYLYRLERYEYAADICTRGITLDPTDKRLLAIKVDIDEMWDPTEK